MKTLTEWIYVGKQSRYFYLYSSVEYFFFKEEKCPTILSQIFTKKLYKRQIWKTYDDMLLYLGGFFLKESKSTGYIL